MDSSLVYFMETKFGPHVRANIERRDGGERNIYNVYKAVAEYNRYMGGVDASDAVRSGYYAIDAMSKTARWTVRFVDSMFNFVLSQGWVAYRYHNANVADYGHFDFMLRVARRFLDNQEDAPRLINTRRVTAEVKLRENFGIHHHLIEAPIQSQNRRKQENCAHCLSLPPSKRKKKYAHDMRSTMMCFECKKYMHVLCHADYHNLKFNLKPIQKDCNIPDPVGKL